MQDNDTQDVRQERADKSMLSSILRCVIVYVVGLSLIVFMVRAGDPFNIGLVLIFLVVFIINLGCLAVASSYAAIQFAAKEHVILLESEKRRFGGYVVLFTSLPVFVFLASGFVAPVATSVMEAPHALFVFAWLFGGGSNAELFTGLVGLMGIIASISSIILFIFYIRWKYYLVMTTFERIVNRVISKRSIT